MYELKKILLFITLIALICVIRISTAHKLNVPRVLLPIFNNFAVNFTLEVTDGGCYKWSTSRTDIIQLIPINENYDKTCSSTILIQTVTRELTRNTAIVLAEDINTGHFLRCDVIVDAIFSLNLITTTKELYIEDIPEAFEVRAYDEQGNEFTTLAGIEFQWIIGDAKYMPSDSESMNNVLRFMTYEESEYERPTSVAMLDSIGKRGHIVLIEGVRTGTAKISVRLPHSEYKHVLPIEMELIVIANLIIIPPEITIMAHDSFKYKIMHTRQGRLEEISLPSNQYFLEAENSDILDINNEHYFAYGRKTGRTKVFLHDKNVREEYPVILPFAIVNVHEVAYISISVLPNRNWGLILDHIHEIIVELYDSKDHKFHIGEGVEVSMKIEEQYIESKSITQNGTYAIGIPISCGTTIIEATLHSIIDKRGKKIMLESQRSTRTELTIHTPVKVQPCALIVPWDVVNKSKSDAMLKASGGDGSYVWSSRQPSIITVLQNGSIKILSMGIAEVTVAMARNQYNKDTAKIYVLQPSKLKIIQYNMEAAIGEPIHLHVALFGKLINGSDVKEVAFSSCRNINFQIQIRSENFVQTYDKNVQPIGTACAVITIINHCCVEISDVTVIYNVNDNHYLMDNITVSAYEPLTAIYPESKRTLLAIGSSRNVVFKGGPLPWTNKSQSYLQNIHLSNKQIAEVLKHEVSSRLFDRTVFTVICKTLGKTMLTYTVSNVPVFSNCQHTYASETIEIVCGKPRYIYLHPEFTDNENCPIGQNANKIIAHSDKHLKIFVIVKDEDGKRFDNFTSLSIEWNFKPSGSGSVEIPWNTIEETRTDVILENVILPKNQYQNIIFKKHYGVLTVFATITGYQKQILNKLQITPEWPLFFIKNERGGMETPLIKTSIEMTLVNDTIVIPNKLIILNDSSIKSNLQVNQGSGYYKFVLSSDEIADIQYIETTRTISIMPRMPGMLRITLVDLCLPSKPAEVHVEVQKLAVIEVDTVNKIEKGKCVTAALKLYDTNGYIIKLPSLSMLDFRTEINNGHIEVKQLLANEQGIAPYERILYKIHGMSEGESHLFFVKKDDHEIQSESVIMQVFVPLQVQPSNLTILIGTIYQMQITGGPPNAEIEFATENDNILLVDHKGILEGKSAGQTKICVRAIGFDAKGNKVIYSENSANVHVLHLEGIKILTPVSRVKTGAIFPLWVFGIPDYLMPLIIGSMQLPLSFAWSSSDPNLLTLHNMYEGTGINIRYQNQVSLRAKAINPGVATIYLNVTVPYSMLSSFNKNDITYSTFVRIEIFEELHLIQPVSSKKTLPILLMSPNSVLQLQTDRDKHGTTTYKILSFTSTHSNESEDSQILIPAMKTVIVTVSKNGIVRSGENFGQTIISITNTEAYNLKQSLTIIIEVKPIHYMMLSLKSKLRIRNNEELNMLPKGMELDYIIEYYDNVGNKFHAAEANSKTLMNRADLASFVIGSNNIITAKFLENGELIMKIFNEKYPTGMFDYVHMMIGDIVFPTKTTLTVGDIICFSMPLLSSDGDPGYWQSSASEILLIDPITGIGRAQNVGHAIIKHSLATHVQGEIEVNILPISRVSIVPLRGKNITGTETFSVPLVLKSKEEEIKENNVLARGLGGCRTSTSFALNIFPYTCNIQFVPSISSIRIKDLFIVKPRFDIITGFYYCDIISISSPTIDASILESRIQINARSRDIESAVLELAYLPPVYINAKEIVFVISQSHGDAFSATFEVHGLPSVLQHLTINVPDGITITWQQYITKTSLQYRLRLTNQDEIQGQKLFIGNDLTKQNISLHIRILKYNHFIPMSGVQWVNYIYFHRYTLGTFAVIVITIFYIWRRKIANVDLTIRNRSIFVDKTPPMMKTIGAPCANISPTTPTSSLRTPLTPPFSAFKSPIYGDPRSFGVPYIRRTIRE